MAYELIRVSELPETTTPDEANVLPIQAGDTLKKITFDNLKEAATGDLADDLAAEVTAREGAVSGEATARGNADTAILADLASPYSASATYAVGDYCTKDGQLYRCTTAISTAEAWTAAHWSAVALGDDTRDLRSALTSVQDNDDAVKNSVLDGKIKVTSNTDVVFLSGENLLVPEIPEDVDVTVKGRNRFDISNATFTFSGYTTSHTLTKENGGIKVVSTVSSGSTYVFVYTEYVAEFSGTLYFTCEASCDGRTRESVRDLVASLNVNGVEQERIYGKGLLYERVNVSVGDTVRIKFYTHAGTEQGNTVYYKNIMLAYGGLYDYMPYASDKKNTEQIPIWARVNLPTDSSKWTASSRRSSSGGGYYCKLTDSTYNLPSASPSIPEANTDVPDIRSNEDVVYWNQLYGIANISGPNGISVSDSGVIGLNHDNLGRTDLMTWLASNPVYIEYKTGESETVPVRLIDRTFNGGEIIVFSEAIDFAYYKDIQSKRCSIVCLGDSITGMFGNSADYPAMIDLTTDITAINAGFSGCRWTDHSSVNYKPFSMNRLADAIATGDYAEQEASALVNPESSSYNPIYAEHLANLEGVDFGVVDFVTLFWGTNDFLSSVIVNSADDPSTEDKQHTNVEDAVRYSIDKILKAYPNLRIIVLTPYWQTPDGNDSDTTPDSNGKYLIDFVNKIASVSADDYHLPVLNLYKTLGVNMLNKYYFEKDDAHPTERLKWILAHRIENAIDLDL